MNHSYKLFPILLLVLISCRTLSVGTDVEFTPISGAPFGRKIFVEKVVLPSNTENVLQKEEKLTISLIDYLDKTKLFGDVAYVGRKSVEEKGYHTLVFKFDTFSHYRGLYPGYFPLAIITFTFYIWFGGPIFVDEKSYSGTIEVWNDKNEKVFSYSNQVFQTERVGKWDPTYLFPNSLPERSALILNLVNAYIIALREKRIR